jgi:hypothetical protein
MGSRRRIAAKVAENLKLFGNREAALEQVRSNA